MNYYVLPCICVVSVSGINICLSLLTLQKKKMKEREVKWTNKAGIKVNILSRSVIAQIEIGLIRSFKTMYSVKAIVSDLSQSYHTISMTLAEVKNYFVMYKANKDKALGLSLLLLLLLLLILLKIEAIVI